MKNLLLVAGWGACVLLSVFALVTIVHLTTHQQTVGVLVNQTRIDPVLSPALVAVRDSGGILLGSDLKGREIVIKTSHVKKLELSKAVNLVR